MNRAASSSKQLCSVCHAELFPNNAFCHSCGAPVQVYELQHSPTIRAGTIEQNYGADEATMRAEQPVLPVQPQQHTPAEAAQNEGA